MGLFFSLTRRSKKLKAFFFVSARSHCSSPLSLSFFFLPLTSLGRVNSTIKFHGYISSLLLSLIYQFVLHDLAYFFKSKEIGHRVGSSDSSKSSQPMILWLPHPYLSGATRFWVITFVFLYLRLCPSRTKCFLPCRCLTILDDTFRRIVSVLDDTPTLSREKKTHIERYFERPDDHNELLFE